MANEIRLLTEREFIEPGETIRVPIVLHLEKPTKVRHISALFRAAEKTKATYTTTSTDSKGRSKTQTKTAVEYYDFAKEEFSLFGEAPRGCLASIGEFFASLFGMGKSVTMQAGRHEYFVEFTVPEIAPPTAKGKKFEIFYKLSSRVDIPLKFDYTAEHEFNIVDRSDEPPRGNPVVAQYPDEEGRGFWQKTFGKDARLTLALQNDAYVRGDEIVALFQAETNEPIKVKQVRAHLICVESSRAKGHTDSYAHRGEFVTIADAQEIIGGFSTEFRLRADLDAPRSTIGNNFHVDWYVEVSMDVPWAMDPTIRAPIRILAPTESS